MKKCFGKRLKDYKKCGNCSPQVLLDCSMATIGNGKSEVA